MVLLWRTDLKKKQK